MAYYDKPKTNRIKASGTRFVNPYNFVPLGDNCERRDSRDIGARPGNLTGYLDCRLKPLTPVFIPNTTNDKALHTPRDHSEEAHSYDFFSYSDLRGKSARDIIDNPSLPVISGSEIRGAVRSVFEAAFNGCLASVDLKRPLGRRSGTPKKAGILRKDKEKDQWEITPCEHLKLKVTLNGEEKKKHYGQCVDFATYEKWEEGQRLYVRKAYTQRRKNGKIIKIPVVTEWKETVQTGSEWELGYLHKGEKFNGKKYEALFVEKKNQPKISINKADVDRLREVLHQYQDTKVNIQARQTPEQKWYGSYKIKEECTLVYYYDNNREKGIPLYLAPACISKEVFSQSIEKLLQQQGGYQPCVSREYVCPACALFGMIPKKGEVVQGKEDAGGARTSRVRFEDAILLNPPSAEQIGRCYLPQMTLPEMGEPKPGAVEFYTLPPSEKQQDETSYEYWTYDYQMMARKSRRLLPEDQPKLRGRKFYWHSDQWKKYEHNHEDPTEMRHMIRPLKPARGIGENEGMLFGFRVYFENITEEELNQLCWALTFNDANCAHKIGRGKPLGFGSVQLRVEQIYRRQINKESGKWSLEPWNPEEYPKEYYNGKSTDAIAVLKAMVNWKQRPKAEVCYPKVEVDSPRGGGKNASASHQWFTRNRGTINRPAFMKVLPKPEEEILEKDPGDKWLYRLKKPY